MRQMGTRFSKDQWRPTKTRGPAYQECRHKGPHLLSSSKNMSMARFPFGLAAEGAGGGVGSRFLCPSARWLALSGGSPFRALTTRGPVGMPSLVLGTTGSYACAFPVPSEALTNPRVLPLEPPGVVFGASKASRNSA